MSQMSESENTEQPNYTGSLLSSPPAVRRDWFAIIFAMVFPTFVTLVYFQWLKDSGSSFQQIAYGVGKFFQFVFPAAWVFLFYRHKLKLEPTKLDIGQFLLGLGFGVLVAATMFAIYFWMIAPSEISGTLTAMVKEKVSGIGVDSTWKYFGMGIFYTLCHSLLEEYYWRWFVFDYLKKFTSTIIANILSSLGFMAHHVIVLAFFFGWSSPLTYLLSISIAVGGAFWAWQYHRTGQLRAPWGSHMIVDAGIFSLGYFLVSDILN